MPDTTFKPGDVVILKSGGEKMTVDAISEFTGLVQCSWFDSKKKFQRQQFQPTSLEKTKAGPTYA